jgi:hypothetical protein
MPIRVLKKHGIVEREGDLVRLNVNPLTLKQKAEVRRICEDRLQRFIAERRLSFFTLSGASAALAPTCLSISTLKISATADSITGLALPC